MRLLRQEVPRNRYLEVNRSRCLLTRQLTRCPDKTFGKRMQKKLWKDGQLIRDDPYGSMSAVDAETLLTLLRRMTCAVNDEQVFS